MIKNSSKKAVKQQRRTYSLDEKASAKRYYLIGLSLQEISKLVDAPIRTIEKWQLSENWKQLRETKQVHIKAYELYLGGKTYKEISMLLNKSTATIWRYLKIAKQNKSNENE
jgi:transposase